MSSLARITARFIGRSYQLGVVDCFGTVLDYISARGHAIPAEFEGYSRATYAAFFAADPAGAKAVMVRLIESILPEIAPTSAVAGDVLLLRLSSSLPFLAIDAGNGHIVAVSEQHGVAVCSVHRYIVERAWRCRR